MPESAVSWTKLMWERTKGGRGREALRLYREMREAGVVPNHHTCVAALKACTTIASLEEGKRIHGHVNGSGQVNMFVANALLGMYAKCGGIEDARRLFDRMRHRDAVSWNTMIAGYVEAGMGAPALELYACMLREGAAPNARTLIAALQACAVQAHGEGGHADSRKASCLEQGRAIHSEAAQKGFVSNIFVANTLVDTYAKLGSMDDACQVFERIPRRNVVSWNTMIIGYAQMGMGMLALELYEGMQHDGFIPDAHTFAAVLKAYASLAAQEEDKGTYLEQGRAIHVEVGKREFESDIFVANTLVDMYAKCGSIVDARQVFDKMPHRDVVSWNTIIVGYARMDMGDPALELYACMKYNGFQPNVRTFIAALKACASMATQEKVKTVDCVDRKTHCLEQGRAIHAEIVKASLQSDILIANTLMDMYAKCGSIHEAYLVFENVSHPDVVSWNALMAGHVQMDMGDIALELYKRMQHEGFTPNSHTFVVALNACASLAAGGKMTNAELLKASYLEQGRNIHSQVMITGLESDAYIKTALIDMYVKCRSIEDACQVFEKMSHRNVASWNAMIIGYAQMEMGNLALDLYARMQREGFPPDARTFVAALKACASLAVQELGKGEDDELVMIGYLEQGRSIHAEAAKMGFESNMFVASTLVDMYAKFGSIEDARHVFEKMRHRDVVSWNAMIIGYAQMEMGDVALELYAHMQHDGMTPDAYTYVAALQGCGDLASLEIGKKIHSQIHRAGLQRESLIANSLIDMYGKCGSMLDAQRFFDSLNVKDSIAWSALIAGYSDQGDSEHVFSLYKRMQQEGIKPDSITLVSVLNVCTHNGLIDKGRAYFHAMHSVFIFPSRTHYTCMTDLLGRAGRLDEATTLVMKMPFQPNMMTWTTILGACQKWNHVETGRNIFQCVATLDEKHAVGHAMIKNIYMPSHMWEEGAKIEKMDQNPEL